jgi:hypothetical protein
LNCFVRRSRLPRLVRHQLLLLPQARQVLHRSSRQGTLSPALFSSLWSHQLTFFRSSRFLLQYTHWKQTVFYTPETLTINQGQKITGSLDCKPNGNNPRDLDIVIEYALQGDESSKKTVNYTMFVFLFFGSLRSNALMLIFKFRLSFPSIQVMICPILPPSLPLLRSPASACFSFL